MRECDWCEEIKLCGTIEESGEEHTICVDCTAYYAAQETFATIITEEVTDAFDL